MQVSKEVLGVNHLKVTVNVDPADYLAPVEQEIKKLCKRLKLPGFRPGMVPPAIARKMYGSAVFLEELNRIVTKQLDQFIQQEQLSVFGEPLLMPMATPTFDLDMPESYSFVFELGLFPKIQLADVSQVVWERRLLAVTPELVQKEVDRLRQQYGTKQYPDVAGDQDLLVGSIEQIHSDPEQSVDPIKRQVRFGLDWVQDEKVRRQLKNLAKHAQIDMHLPTAFGSDEELLIHRILQVDYETAHRLGHRVRFTLEQIVHIEPAELNQSFFDRLWGVGVVTTVEQMTERLAADLHKYYEQQADARLNAAMRQYLIDHSLIELPEAFVRRLLNRKRKEQEEELTDQQFAVALQQVRWELLTHEIVRQQNLLTTDEQLMDEALADVMEYFGAKGSLADETKDRFRALAEALLADEDTRRRLQRRLIQKLVIQHLRSKVTIQDRLVSEHEFFHH